MQSDEIPSDEGAEAGGIMRELGDLSYGAMVEKRALARLRARKTLAHFLEILTVFCPGLTLVMDAWPMLSAEERAAILLIVEGKK